MKENEFLISIARKGAEINSTPGKMCAGCAFKPRTAANYDELNVSQIVHCMLFNHPFYCHVNSEGRHEGDPGFTHEVCRGYLYAKQYYGFLDNPTNSINKNYETGATS